MTAANANATTNPFRSFCVIGAGNFTTCSFSLSRNSSEYLFMFFTDIMLFYLMPLLLSVVLYSLIARTLLVASRKGFGSGGGGSGGNSLANGGGASAMSVCEAASKTNQARVQVSSSEERMIQNNITILDNAKRRT